MISLPYPATCFDFQNEDHVQETKYVTITANTMIAVSILGFLYLTFFIKKSIRLN